MRQVTKINWLAVGIIVLLGINPGEGAFQGAKFRIDDPLWDDPDRLSIPQPTERPMSKMVDLLGKTFGESVGGQVEAANVNTLGEVMNSSWFTNRMSQAVMPIEELVRGANQGDGPDMSEPWTIVSAKTEGVTPGFRIRDARGDVYFIKFDPLYWPQMATSSEVIGTKFFHAFGYNVPENYLVHWLPEYEIDTTAEVTWESGQEDTLSEGFVRNVLKNVPRRPDGRIQVMASKALPGTPLGPFDFEGTRSDDPNDIVVHQDRRELRGYRIFAAWLNHNDSDSVNTLDVYYTDDNGDSWVQHYLIDFGTVMGSGAVQPHARRVGNEYYIEFGPAIASAVTLGLVDRPWRHVEYPDYPSIGRFESSYFQPESWKPDYRNPAFDKMTLQDALWATRTIMRFSDQAVRAIVETGQLEDPEAEEYLVQTLIERRDKIVNYYLSEINPIDGFEVRGDRLDFVNLGVDAGLASECSYAYQWSVFDNQAGVLNPLNTEGTVSETTIPLPSADGQFLMVKIGSRCPGQPNWVSDVDVYLRDAGELSVVGIDRADPPLD